MTMTIEVEEMAFGKVFRTLDGMPGVIAIKIAGTGPKKPKGNSKGNSGGRTSAQIVLAELVRQPLDKGALTQRLEEGGKKATSLPDTLYKLRNQKLITGSAAKGYKITKAGLSAAAEEKANG